MNAPIVLTEAGAAIHRPGVIERALTASALMDDPAARFDLLAAPDFRELLDVDNPDFASVLAGDVRQIAESRGATRLVVAVYGDPSPFVARFREGSGWYRGVRLKTHGINLARFAEPVPMTRLIVTASDHRLHGWSGGLIDRAVHALGPAAYGVLAMGNGAAGLAEPSLRQSMAIAGLKALRRREPALKELVITTPFDHRAGGDDPIARLAALSRATEQAAAALSAAVDLPSTALIAMIDRDRLLRFRSTMPPLF